MKKKSEKENPSLRQEDYDGYYEDRIPVDDGSIEPEFDKEPLKKIAAVIAGALVMSIISIYLIGAGRPGYL